MKKLFLTRELPEPVMEKLKANFELKVNPHDRTLTKQEIIEGITWCDILLCLLTDNIDRDIIDANPNLSGIVNYAVGYNNIDVDHATSRKIPVTNTPGVLTDTTADLAWSLLCSIARRIVEADRYIREDKFADWAPQLFLGTDIYGKTLGIIGAGRIGTAVAKRAKGFDMEILYFDQNRQIENHLEAKQVDLDILLKESDFISLHVPLIPETTHLIEHSSFKMMKTSAFLINTSRGSVVDEKALLGALQKKEIAGAALDVYEHEPKITSGLKELNNIVLVPHIGSATNETRTKMGLIAFRNALKIAEKEIPPNLVNKEIYDEN